MANNSLLINQGSNSSVNFDSVNGTFTQIIGLGYGTVNTLGTLPNLPGGTLNAGTVQISGGTVSVNELSGTVNLGTITGNIGMSSGTLNVGTATTNQATGTLNVGTINNGTFVMPSGTLTVLPNLPQGSINVTAGTIATLGTMGTLGTALGVGVVTTVTNLSNGTIQNSGTVTGVGVLSVLSKGTISLGSIGGIDANAAAQTGQPVTIGGTDSGGTVRTILINAAGAQNVGTLNNGTVVIPSGTINVGTFAMTSGTLNLGTVNMASGTLNVGTATTNQLTGTLNVGTINTGTFVMPSGTLTTGSLSNVAMINAGTLGTIANLGQVYNAGTLQAGTISLGSVVKVTPAPTAGSFTAAGSVVQAGSQLDIASFDIQGTYVGTVFFEGQIGTSSWFGIPAFSNAGVIGTQTTGNGDYFVSMAGLDGARARLTYSSGTLTYNSRTSNFYYPGYMSLGGSLGNVGMLNAGTISTLPNLPGGTINILAGGTLGILTNGTISSSGTSTGVGTVTNLGSVTNVGQLYNAGTVQNILAGTLTALQNGTIAAGSIVVIAGTQSVGTINTGTINTGTFSMTSGTLNVGTITNNGGTLQNLNFGTIALSDGTTKANVMASGVSNGTGAQNAQLMNGGFSEFSGSATAGTADLIASFDVGNYRSFSLQIAGTFVGTINAQVSNDNSNFGTLQVNPVNLPSAFPTSVINSNNLYYSNLASRYLRIRMMAFTSGTANATLELFSLPTAPMAIVGAMSQSGAYNVGGTVFNQALTAFGTFLGTTGAVTGTTIMGTLTGLGTYRSMNLFANLQGAGGTAKTDIYIQSSPDGGVTWVDYAHFGQLAASATSLTAFTTSKGANAQLAAGMYTVGTGNVPALGVGTVIGGDWGDRFRFVAAIAAGGTNAGTETFNIALTT